MVNTEIERNFSDMPSMSSFIVGTADIGKNIVIIGYKHLILDLWDNIMSGYIVNTNDIFIGNFKTESDDLYVLSLKSDFEIDVVPESFDSSRYLINDADYVFVSDECNYSYVSKLANNDINYTLFTIEDESECLDYNSECDDCCNYCDTYDDDIFAEDSFEIGPPFGLHIENMYGNIIYGDNVCNYKEA